MLIDPKYFRPTEVENLRADYTKSKNQLNWEPKVSFKELVRIMVDCDLEYLGLSSPGERKRIIHEEGFKWNKK